MTNFDKIKDRVVDVGMLYNIWHESFGDEQKGIEAYGALFDVKTDKPYKDNIFMDAVSEQIIRSMKYHKIKEFIVTFVNPELGPGYYRCGWIALARVA